MKSGLIYFIRSAMFYLKANKKDEKYTFPYVKRCRNSQFQILSYHRVNNRQELFFSGISVAKFERQMEILSEYFHVLPLEQLVEQSLTSDMPPYAIAITFDDGYQDNYKHAYPVLKRFGLPATIYLATGTIGTNIPLWHDRVFDAFRRTTVDSLFFDDRTYSLKTNSEKRYALNNFLRKIRMYDPSQREQCICHVIERMGIPGINPDSAKKLSWDEIKEMSLTNISFGAHTVTHPILTRMPIKEAIREIQESKNMIEHYLHEPIRLFAYPNGSSEDFNEPIKQALKETDFLCAVTTLYGVNSNQTDPFEMRRVGLWDADPDFSALRLVWNNFNS